MKYSRTIAGDALTELRKLPEKSVHCCVTSPPYWGLRDYGVAGQLGLEKTPEEYVAHMVEIFREVRRVLRDDGTLWLNLGDSYATSNPVGRRDCGDGELREGRSEPDGSFSVNARKWRPGAWEKGKVDERGQRNRNGVGAVPGLKPKDLVGIPWRMAFALQADGWYLRSDIIWAKPNPMPESVRDRPTRSHEYIFLMSKNARYYYDAEAVREDGPTYIRKASGYTTPETQGCYDGRRGKGFAENDTITVGRNRRSVWTIATRPYAEAHFATFPPEIPERCIKAGCPKGGVVLDPFFGAGTTGLVAMRLGREFIGIELNEKYCEMAEKRIYGELMAGAT